MRRDRILLLLAFLLSIQGYLFENVFPVLLAFTIIVYLIYLRSEFKPRIEAERWIDHKLIEGKRSTSKLRLRNLTKKKFKIRIVEEFLPPGFKAEEPIFILNENEDKVVEYKIVPVRGVYKIRGPKIEVTDLQEMNRIDFVVDSEIDLEVYPSIDRIKEDIRAERSMELATMYKRALIGLQTMDLHSLRRFQPGDDTRLIEWKATARLNELIVKDLFREIEGDVYIILDAGREMRKGVRNSKIDYATTLTLQLVYALRKYRIGLIVYDDFGVKFKVQASKSQIDKIVRSLRVSPIYTDLMSVKLPKISFKLSDKSRNFLKRILPMIKRRRGFSTGLIEAVSSLPSSAFLIFISDITSNTSELIKVLSELKDRYKIILLAPNPILFYDESKIDKERIIWLYKRYLEREELIKKLNKIVPTIDLGPSDLLDVVEGVLK